MPANSSAADKGIQISSKHVLIIISIMGGLAALHSSVMVPMIRDSMRPAIEDAISHHAASVHTEQITRREFSHILSRLDRLDDSIQNLHARRGSK